MKKRIISLFTILAIVTSTMVGIIQTFAVSLDDSNSDPFALMYDSTAELKDMIFEIVEEDELKENGVDQAATLGYSKENLAKDVMEIIADEEMSELQTLPLSDKQKQKIEAAVRTVGESRYIIKFKDAGEQIASYLDTGDVGEFTVDTLGDSSELLVLDGAINPSRLAKILKNQNLEEKLEYIQPDFKLGLSNEESFLLEIENGTSTPHPKTEEGDSGASVVTKPVEPENIPEKEDTMGTETPPSDGSTEEVPEVPEETEPTIPTEPVEPIVPVDPVVPEEPILPLEPEPLPDSESEAVIVAMIDTGVDVSHPDIKDRLWKDENGSCGWNFIDDFDQIYDENRPEFSSHGTHVAGLIADETEHAEIMVLQTFGRFGAYTSDIIRAIHFAEENGATIVNCGFVGDTYNRALEDAIAASDMLFVAAAGNDRNDLQETPVYPACFDLENILCVASVNEDGGLSYYSNYSDEYVDIAAIGRDVVSCLPENEQGMMSGTSMAAATVTGVAASVLEQERTLSAESLKMCLEDTSVQLSNLQEYVSSGRQVSAERAMEGIESILEVENDPADDFAVSSVDRDASVAYRMYQNAGKNIQVELTDSAVIVLKDDGTVWAWGKNEEGVCGDTDEILTQACQIPGLRNITQIDAGNDFCLALRADGTVWSWGSNSNGQLGTGSTSSKRDIPEQVVGLTNVVDISAGSTHAMAVRSNERLYAWGNNADYQLGDGTTDETNIPIRVDISDIVQAAAGSSHSLALDETGLVWSWGENNYGQLGDSTTIVSEEPCESDMTDAVYISAGDDFSLAIDEGGDAYSWGENTNGQLGNGNEVDKDSPVSVDNITLVEMLKANDNSTIAITNGGEVWTWGDNGEGQLGIGDKTDADAPVQVDGLSDCVDVDINSNNGAAVTDDGTIWVWGDNSYGTLGDNQQTMYWEPVVIPSLSGYSSIVAGDQYSMAISADEEVYGWGDNRGEHLGNTTDEVVQIPSLIDLSSVEQVALGYDHVLARRSSGRVYAWGDNGQGQLGDGSNTDSDEPVRTDDITDTIDIAAGYRFSLACDEVGDAYSWGDGRYGQLGNLDTVDEDIPYLIDNLSDIIDVAAGRRHGMALEDNGRVWTWGYNNRGQLGDGTEDDCTEACRISYPRSVTQIDAAEYFSVALDEDGDVWTWGENSEGQLGLGDYDDYTEAEKVNDISDVVKIDAGEDFCLALKSDGTVWGWGDNDHYKLARKYDSLDYEDPIQIRGLEDIVDISAGSDHCFAIDSTGTVYGWGSNIEVQLGIPRLCESLTPIKAQSYIENLYFAKNAYTVNIPDSGSTSATVAVYGNSLTDKITPTMATYQLAAPYTGVSVSTNGTVTVASSAPVGRVKINASYGDLTAQTELVLRKVSTESDGTLTFSAISNEIYDVAFVAENVQSFAGKTFTLTYDPAVLKIEDLCALSFEKEAATGPLPRNGIHVTQLGTGTIVFTVDKEIASGQKWSGAANVFALQAIADGTTSVQISQTAAAS